MPSPISDTTIYIYKKHANEWDEIRKKFLREILDGAFFIRNPIERQYT